MPKDRLKNLRDLDIIVNGGKTVLTLSPAAQLYPPKVSAQYIDPALGQTSQVRSDTSAVPDCSALRRWGRLRQLIPKLRNSRLCLHRAVGHLPRDHVRWHRGHRQLRPDQGTSWAYCGRRSAAGCVWSPHRLRASAASLLCEPHRQSPRSSADAFAVDLRSDQRQPRQAVAQGGQGRVQAGQGQAAPAPPLSAPSLFGLLPPGAAIC